EGAGIGQVDRFNVGMVQILGFWVARPEVLRRAWVACKHATPFGVPQGVGRLQARHALRGTSGRGSPVSTPRPSEYLRACHPHLNHALMWGKFVTCRGYLRQVANLPHNAEPLVDRRVQHM